ncbi:MAG: TetR/AcrR family transcriptional regulator [Solirubrobacterales bacterium]|nr:TetR/AcrR family transcriptional regulator [Solirubrobacterales bacterium]
MRRRAPAPVATAGPAQRGEVAAAQRARLLAAMAEVVAEVGYEESTVQLVLDRSGISRKTFYEQFADREDCFVAAYDAATADVLDTVAAACAGADVSERRIELGLEALLDWCTAHPAAARMCVVEVFAAGSRARQRRAATMERLGELAERALDGAGAAGAGGAQLDRLTARALVGAVHELIYRPLERGDAQALDGLADEILAAHVEPLLATRR